MAVRNGAQVAEGTDVKPLSDVNATALPVRLK